MTNSNKVHIIGIGDDGLAGLTGTARELIEQAEVLIGTEKTLALRQGDPREQLAVGSDLSVVPDAVSANAGKRIVILAVGDPLFYGVARYLCEQLGKDQFEVVPHVSSMQLAFARVKESWEEAYLTNLANQNLDVVAEKIRTSNTVGLFTSEEVPPSVIAKTLLDRQIDYFIAYVCENLGSPDERVTSAELGELIDQEFSSLNVMVLVRKPNAPDRPTERIGRRLFGNPDESFLQSQPKQGLLTPAEVRSMALAQMDLGPTSIVWDVGAGSGSVAIEAAQIASGGTTFAIEMDVDDHQLILANVEKFGVTNLVPVLGQAPEAWEDLPQPDSIFFGGTGHGIGAVVELAFDRLRNGGRLIVNVASVENLSSIHEVLNRKAANVQVWMINVARGNYQLERVRFESLNPTFLIGVVKE